VTQRVERLTAAQGQAILLLVEGYGISTIAERVGVDRTTLLRWRRAPTFAAEYERAREETHDRGIRVLQAAIGQAVGAIVEIVRDPEVDPGVRLRAAEAILDRVGLAPTARVEVVDGDPEARLRELLGLAGPNVIEMVESQIDEVHPTIDGESEARNVVTLAAAGDHTHEPEHG
jgi:transposase-like protein